MSVVKGLALAGLLVTALVAWRELPALLGHSGQAPAVARSGPIQFDNGSVRQLLPPASAPGLRTPDQAPNALRKCVRGSSITYTNVDCPPGHHSQPVRADRVNVVPATPTGRAPADPLAGGNAPPAPAGRAGVHQALDLSATAQRREQAQQRAVDQQTR